MKIAFYLAKHGTFYDKLISFTTRSIYSHCEIIFEDGLCASSSIRDGGIRFAKIDFEKSGHWHVYDLTTEKLEIDVIDWFRENDSDTYDLPGAIGSLFGLDFTSDDKKFCSQACAAVLGLKTIITPGKLFNLMKDIRMI